MSEGNSSELNPGLMMLLGAGLGATGGLLLLKRHVVLGGISLLTGAFLGVRGQELRESGGHAPAGDTEPQASPVLLEAAPEPSTETSSKEASVVSTGAAPSEKGGTSGGEASEAASASPDVTEEKSTAAPPSEEGGTSKASGDDLRQVKGIGPKTVTILNAAGIHTFAELAATGEERLTEILREAGLRITNPEGWPEQAVELAKG